MKNVSRTLIDDESQIEVDENVQSINDGCVNWFEAVTKCLLNRLMM